MHRYVRVHSKVALLHIPVSRSYAAKQTLQLAYKRPGLFR
jgi:hypothetical protein